MLREAPAGHLVSRQPVLILLPSPRVTVFALAGLRFCARPLREDRGLVGLRAESRARRARGLVSPFLKGPAPEVLPCSEQLRVCT